MLSSMLFSYISVWYALALRVGLEWPAAEKTILAPELMALDALGFASGAGLVRTCNVVFILVVDIGDEAGSLNVS